MILPIVIGSRILGTGAALTGVAAAGYKTGQFAGNVIRQKLRPQPPVTYAPKRVSPSARQEGAKPRSPRVTQSSSQYRPNTPSSPRKPATQAPTTQRTTSRSGSKGSGTSKRTRMVQTRLKRAQARAAVGDVQGAANFAAAALKLQQGGKGSAKSLKRVERVAGSYSKAAGRSAIRNEMAKSRTAQSKRKGK